MKKQWIIYSGIGLVVLALMYFVYQKYQDKKANDSLEANLTKSAKDGRTISIQINKAI